jgi:hypothetical protein
VKERQRRRHGEPHQLVTAMVHPPEALGQHAARKPTTGRGARAKRRALVGVGEIA